jgi:hypothetical protein
LWQALAFFGTMLGGRMLALALLIIGTIYDANSFAWGFSIGPPTLRVRLLSHIIVVAW